MIPALLLAITLAAPDPSWPFADRTQVFGGTLAPAQLPRGALALYGTAGFPEIDAGYRQGFAGFELEGRALFDYHRVSLGAELGVRALRVAAGPLELAPQLTLGVVQDFGSTYFDAMNTAYLGARVRGGLSATLRLGERVYGLAAVDLPLERALTVGDTWRFFPTAGLGAEVYLTEDVTVGAVARAGAEWVVDRTVLELRPTFALRFGLGYRLF